MNSDLTTFGNSILYSVTTVTSKNHSLGTVAKNTLLMGGQAPRISSFPNEAGSGDTALRVTADLYVSATLETIEIEFIPELGRSGYARDCCFSNATGERNYRRLDLDWYAWLRDRMHAAKAAGLEPDLWNSLRVAFNGVREWALVKWGAEALSMATAPKGYRAP
jgi:hypothetical protein